MQPPPLLTVIVPLYNAGAFFKPFIESLLAQTFQQLEIIIVDDGSTDGSGESAEKYASSVAHMRVLHQANGGVSRARNTGLQQARGKYVTFPDADDILEPQMYQTLMEMVLADDLDAAQCNARRIHANDNDGIPLIPFERLRSTPSLSGTEWLNRALKTRRYLHVVWLGVYRLSLIKSCHLRFIPGLHHQDIPWTTEFMFNARSVRYCDALLYRYRIHHESVSHRKRHGRQNVRYQRHYLRICALLDDINHRYQHQVPVCRSFHAQITREALSVCHAIRREPDADARRTMIHDLLRTRTPQRMMRNARGLTQWYKLLVWHIRLLYLYHFQRVNH
nr:glycosyltransferase [uncultured Erwinia sp.]